MNLRAGEPNEEELKVCHRLAKKVGEDIENMGMNTAISAFMIAINALSKMKEPLTSDAASMVIRALAPFAPHFCEELWQRFGGEGLVIDAEFPQYEEQYMLMILLAIRSW